MEQTRTRVTMKRLEGDSLTPVLIFRRLRGKHRFLLESSAQHAGSGRYSFIGVNPVKRFRGTAGKLEEYVYQTGERYEHAGELFSLMKRLLPRMEETGEFPFMGGAVGYFSYGATGVGGEDAGLPDLYFHLYDTVIVFDHLANDVTLLHADISVEAREAPDLEALAEQILNGPAEMEAGAELSGFTSDQTKQEFEERVREAQQFIAEGAAEQIVLSRRLTADMEGDPFELYRRLRKRNPSPYLYYMEFDDHAVVGSSPESLVRVTDGLVVTNPIAGTRRRGHDEAEDQALEAELRHDPKELAEHRMLVKLSKREMAGICMPESVCVTADMETVRYEHVMHLVSEVEGRLASGVHPLDALRGTMPAGTVTGSPKRVAMEVIADLEPSPRGLYGGAIGYIGLNGNIDFALAIRTMLVKGGKAVVQAGAGIVADSIPALEYKETENKARSLLLGGRETV